MQMAEAILNVFPKIPNSKIILSNSKEKSDRKRIEIGISILAAGGL